MDALANFFAAIAESPVMTLATEAAHRVTMRTVSPVRYQDGILIFTAASSCKFQQLQENPHGCLALGNFFAEATVTFCGATMLPENAPLRTAYCEKFPGAFDEGIAFGGRDAEFLLFHPTRLSGWAFPEGQATADGIPTIPFAIELV